MHFVFNSIFVRLYFVLRPQVVPRQRLTQVVYNFQSFSRCFIRRRFHPRVEFFDLASHRFQFGFALYYPVMDRLQAEIGSRFDSSNKSLLNSISTLDPRSGNFLQLDHLDTFATQYNINKEFLELELRQAKRLVTSKKAANF